MKDACAGLAIVVPDDRLPPIYGRLLADLKRRGDVVPAMDLLIAASALADDAELVSADKRHFARIRDLRLVRY